MALSERTIQRNDEGNASKRLYLLHTIQKTFLHGLQSSLIILASYSSTIFVTNVCKLWTMPTRRHCVPAEQLMRNVTKNRGLEGIVSNRALLQPTVT